MYKIIFVDIDGTLRNDKKEITDRTKVAIHKIVEKGIPVVICSGRPRQYTKKVSQEALASNYIIVCNGGEAYDYERKEVIYQNNLDNKEILTLYQMAEKYDVQFIINLGENRIVRNPTGNKTDIILKEPIEKFINAKSSTQCIFSSMQLEKIKVIKEKIQSIKDLEIVNLSKCLTNYNEPEEKPFFLDIASKSTSKGNAIKKLCEYLKIDLKDSVAIGDSYNDLTMFQVVGHTVAMGNAPDDIKKIVDEVTNTNNEEGVAKFLEKVYKEVF